MIKSIASLHSLHSAVALFLNIPIVSGELSCKFITEKVFVSLQETMCIKFLFTSATFDTVFGNKIQIMIEREN